jgi:hypothetical protein
MNDDSHPSSGGSQYLAPTLTEVVEAWESGPMPQDGLRGAADAAKTEVVDVVALAPAPTPQAASLNEDQIVQRVLLDLQRQIDLMLEYRVREAMIWHRPCEASWPSQWLRNWRVIAKCDRNVKAADTHVVGAPGSKPRVWVWFPIPSLAPRYPGGDANFFGVLCRPLSSTLFFVFLLSQLSQTGVIACKSN